MPATLDGVMALLYEIKSDLAAMKAGGVGSPAASAGGGSGATDTFHEDKLREQWADKDVEKLPKYWTGRDFTGLRYSQLTADEANAVAKDFQWKADNPLMDKETGKPRLQTKGKNAGKPWSDVDAFNAKLLRTWAKVAAVRKPAKAPAKDDADGFGSGPSDADESQFTSDIPF